jgi:hypothetical protein
MFSVLSILRCYKQDKSRVSSALRQSLASNDVSMEVEGSAALEAVTRQQMVKTQQIEKT